MAAIWRNDGTGWNLFLPSGFTNEKALHDRVEEAPQVLPLAGAPGLVVLGREVQLGTGIADLIAVEASGRLAIIEVKLASNAEARRAVVAQVLSYAAFLHGTDPAGLEQGLLAAHLHTRGYESIAQAVAASDQTGSFDEDDFREQLAYHLEQGSFRLVLALDQAPAELVRLVGYLQSVTGDRLLIDLITISAYEIGNTQILVPSRVEPERPVLEPQAAAPVKTTKQHGVLSVGSQVFVDSCTSAPAAAQPALKRFIEWASALEAKGIARLYTFVGGSGRVTLLPYLPMENAGLVTIWNDVGAANPAYLTLWRSVFNRRAPKTMPRVEQLLGTTIGQGTVARDPSDDLLAALTDAHAEAAAGVFTPST